MTSSNGRTPVGQSDDGPNSPTTAEGAHHAHNSIPNNSDTPADLGDQVLHPFQTKLSLAQVGTAGSSHSALVVVKGTPVASIARPKLFDSKGMPSELARSARASNGLAERAPRCSQC